MEILIFFTIIFLLIFFYSSYKILSLLLIPFKIAFKFTLMLISLLYALVVKVLTQRKNKQQSIDRVQ